MSTPILAPTELQPIIQQRPTAILLFRTPVPPSQGTDPYHDAFGPFCLPSFPLSALESGSSTPLPPPIGAMSSMSIGDRSGADMLKSALSSSKTGRRRGRWIDDDAMLTTHHLAPDPDALPAGYVTFDEDGNEDEVPKREFCVTSIPILGHTLLNYDILAKKIMHGSESGQPYRGAIITSQRAVEAWAQAASGTNLTEELREGKKPVTTWQRSPFFAVGPATGEALRALGKQLPQTIRTSLVMGAGATGTGEALATYVIRHFNGPAGAAAPGHEMDKDDEDGATPPPPPLLLLTGDKNAPTIPDALKAARPPIPFEELQVYETSLDNNFGHSCDALSRSLPPNPQSRPGSRRGSRSGSNSSTRRPSVGSLWGGGAGGMGGGGSPLAGIEGAFARRKNSLAAAAVDNPAAGMGAAQVSSGNQPSNNSNGSTPNPPSNNAMGLQGLSAMTPMAGKESASSAVVSSPIDESPFPLDVDIGLGTGPGTRPDWLVFFSPSGLQYAMADLRKRGWLPPDYGHKEVASQSAVDTERGQRKTWLSAGPPDGFPRIAVLGPTTKRFLRTELGFQPDAVAATPGASELREAIRVAEKRIRRERDKVKAEAELKKRKDKEEKARLVGLADGGGVPMEMD